MSIKFLKLFFLLLPFIILSCDKEEGPVTNCIIDVETTFSDDCSTKMGSDTCELKYIGEKLVPQEMKQAFESFCINKDDEIQFENQAGDLLTFNVGGTSLLQSGAVIFHRQDTCITYCHDREVATKHLKSSDLNCYFQLGTFVDDYSNYEDIESELYIGFSFHETKPLNVSGSLSIATLHIPLLDSQDQDIPLDTSKYIFHTSIMLNGKSFSKVYTRKERYFDYLIPYFSLEGGLIGFEDEFDVLWARVD